MTVNSIDLSSAGVIVKLTIRQWSGRRGDKQAGRETAERTGAEAHMLRVSKSLIPLEALEPIRRLSAEIRAYHYENTIVWADSAQFLPVSLSISYSSVLQDYRLRFDRLVDEFCNRYPLLLEGAPALLGQLHRPEDYPSPRRIRQRFGLEVAYEPVPQAGHFFSRLAADTLAEYRSSLEAKNRERERAMRRDLWERLSEPVLKMAEALSDPERIFRNSLVANIQDIAQRIDSLNIFNDPEMTSVALSLRETLAKLDPDVLRHSTDDRRAAADAARTMADRIAHNMSGFMALAVAA